jgi:hypothetical protein
MQARLKLSDGVGELLGILIGRAKEVKSVTLRGLAADAWQLLQFFDEASHGLGKA